MGVFSETAYYFQKVYLYAPGQPKMKSSVPFGSAEIEMVGMKGALKCRVRDLPSVFTPLDTISLLICSNGGEQPLVIGQLQLDKLGIGECRWDFNILNIKDGSTEGLVDYELLVTAQPVESFNKKGNYVLLKGIFSLIHEIRDSRVIKFKKEGKVQETAPEQIRKNPLFFKVEPFEPPNPNVVWWQISIQPGFSKNDWQPAFCPRQKSKAIF